MKSAILQHQPSVTAGSTIDWLQLRQVQFQVYPLFENPNLPNTEDFDLLIICGGTMNVDDDKIYPWLATEKTLIKNIIKKKKPIVGLCLGAQLVAESLGATVGKHHLKEIGWHEVELSNQSITAENSLTVFQWHEYAFSLPPGCRLLATNKNCINQAYELDPFILAFQFHPEATKEWILKCAADPKIPQPSLTVQSAEQIKKDIANQSLLQDWYFKQLDLLIKNNFNAKL